ncbi:thiol-disulfide isomerase/thioredoxin [Bradyrhizobium sp. AZCC 2289]
MRPGLPSRRGALIGGLAAAAVWFDPAAAATSPPAFSSGRYQFTLLAPQRMLPSIRLFRLAGGSFDLAALRGRPILLNFWASWCAACRVELPVLDRLSQKTTNRDLRVIAVWEDRGSRDQVSRFIQSLAIPNLAVCLDPNGYVAHTDPDRTGAPFALYGMPITYLIARSGGIVGYMPGAADWTEPAAEALIAYLQTA